MRTRRKSTASRLSAIRSGLTLSAAGILICGGTWWGKTQQTKQASTPTSTRLAREGTNWRSTSASSPHDSPADRSDVYRTCRAHQTEIHQFGAVRLIDVGDEVTTLGPFLGAQQREAMTRHEPCLVIVSLASCPSCAAIGFAVTSGAMARVLGPLSVLRIDIEEFSEELRKLGIAPSQVPVFARFDASGNLAAMLDGSVWPGNDPAEFLPLLRDFVRGQVPHQRGGRYSNPKQGSLAL